jgi:hypothetical protein
MTRRTVAVLVLSALAIRWWEKPETKRSKMASRRSKSLVRRLFAAARASSRYEGDAGSSAMLQNSCAAGSANE